MAGGAAVAVVASVSAQQPEPVVPLHREPHHRQVFQRGPVRIIDMQLPPGDRSWFHTHDAPVLLLALSSSPTRTQILGQEWGGGGAGGAAPAAAATGPTAGPRSIRPSSTISYAETPVTHRLENLGSGVARNIVVVNESAGDDSMTEQQAGFTATPELANKWFRAYRIGLGPGERTAAHTHTARVVIVQVGDGTAVGSGASTWEFNTPGQWGFFEAREPHAFANTGTERLELIEVEIRTK